MNVVEKAGSGATASQFVTPGLSVSDSGGIDPEPVGQTGSAIWSYFGPGQRVMFPTSSDTRRTTLAFAATMTRAVINVTANTNTDAGVEAQVQKNGVTVATLQIGTDTGIIAVDVADEDFTEGDEISLRCDQTTTGNINITSWALYWEIAA